MSRFWTILGREECEAVAYIAQSDTILLKRPAKDSTIEKRPGNAGDHPRRVIAYFAITAVVGPRGITNKAANVIFSYAFAA